MLLSAAHCAGVFIENGIYLGGNTADGAGSLRFSVEKELAHPGYGALSCQRILLIVLHISTKPDNSIRGSLFQQTQFQMQTVSATQTSLSHQKQIVLI